MFEAVKMNKDDILKAIKQYNLVNIIESIEQNLLSEDTIKDFVFNTISEWDENDLKAILEYLSEEFSIGDDD